MKTWVIEWEMGGGLKIQARLNADTEQAAERQAVAALEKFSAWRGSFGRPVVRQLLCPDVAL